MFLACGGLPPAAPAANSPPHPIPNAHIRAVSCSSPPRVWESRRAEGPDAISPPELVERGVTGLIEGTQDPAEALPPGSPPWPLLLLSAPSSPDRGRVPA
eukprot:3187323-Prymnesium_polylepis.2